MYHLFLASHSRTRQHLLTSAQLPCTIIEHHADERSIMWDSSIHEMVIRLALLKMEHVAMPVGYENELVFVLTADTLIADAGGKLYGKPHDYAEATRMIRALRDYAHIATGFCLEKKQYIDMAWKTVHRVTQVQDGTCISDIPDKWIDYYLARTDYTSLAGALAIDNVGALFIKEIRGSYGAILGLPMAELRIALTNSGFFE